jgi:geranylgeranyl diphosphate synthase type I
MLVHDDIIDKAETRRGKPSMHAMLKRHLPGNKKLKFNSQDLSLVIGDVIYAMSLHAFLSIREDRGRKEAALRKLIASAVYTGSGEFIELLNGIKSLDKISKNDIYKIYDLKTADYTFASPLSIGAILAGADKKQIRILFRYGMLLGRAFQIRDDILGMFAQGSKTGKDDLVDLREARRTILIWYAYNNSDRKNQSIIRRILVKNNVNKRDLMRMRRLVQDSGALAYAREEISKLLRKAENLSRHSRMQRKYINSINDYAKKILA